VVNIASRWANRIMFSPPVAGDPISEAGLIPS
jgi:hypothetical protein